MKALLAATIVASAIGCAHKNSGSARLYDSPSTTNDAKVIYDALRTAAVTEASVAPGGTISLVKQVGRLRCTLFQAPEALYTCNLSSGAGADQAIYDDLSVPAVASADPGAAQWRKT